MVTDSLELWDGGIPKAAEATYLGEHPWLPFENNFNLNLIIRIVGGKKSKQYRVKN